MHVQGSHIQAYACTSLSNYQGRTTTTKMTTTDKIEHVAEHEGKPKTLLPSQMSLLKWL